MKYIFIVNPAAGSENIINKIEADNGIGSAIKIGKKLGLDVAIYKTKGVKDAHNFCTKLFTENPDEKYRIYACGGDGTLNEVVGACFGHRNVEVGVVPQGTGNDFVRNFSDKYDFFDFEGQLFGQSTYCDLIEYSKIEGTDYAVKKGYEPDSDMSHESESQMPPESKSGDEAPKKYCANMFNIGFDCNVVELTARLKTYPLIKGSFAYLLSVLIVLIKMAGTKLELEFEDGTTNKVSLLLLAIGNGAYCGGGVKGVPLAELTDGLMDVSAISPMSRLKFISLFPRYSKGVHLQTEDAKRYIDYRKERRLVLKSIDKPFKVSVDGEIFETKGLSLCVKKEGIKIILPVKK